MLSHALRPDHQTLVRRHGSRSRAVLQGRRAKRCVVRLRNGRMAEMASKASFTPQEWVLLLQSPMMAGIAVSAAEPSGLFGMLQESFATGKLLVQATSDTTANELVK